MEAGIEVNEPKTMEERKVVASICILDLNLSIPALIDGMDNNVEIYYAAWPNRLYVVDKESKIAYKSEQGPMGFEPLEMEKTLKTLCNP